VVSPAQSSAERRSLLGASRRGGGFFDTMRVYPELELGLVAMGNATDWDHLRLFRLEISVAE
jgi:hypothetical protein